MNNEDCFENIFDGCKGFVMILVGERICFYFAVCFTNCGYRGTVSFFLNGIQEEEEFLVAIKHW